jgi:hypothetical protein
MDADSIIAAWKRRLTTLAENPTYVFKNTPEHLIRAHQRRLTTFIGYPKSMVAQVELRLGVQLPAVFRTYMTEMAKSRGDLFCGSDLAGIAEVGAIEADFGEFRTDALSSMKTTDPSLSLPSDAVVFLHHQGCRYAYLRAAGGFDATVEVFCEGEREIRHVPSFAEFVDADLRSMESTNREKHEGRNYTYVTLYPNGSAMMQTDRNKM